MFLNVYHKHITLKSSLSLKRYYITISEKIPNGEHKNNFGVKFEGIIFYILNKIYLI